LLVASSRESEGAGGAGRRAAGPVLLVLGGLLAVVLLLAAAEFLATYLTSEQSGNPEADAMFGDDVFRTLAVLEKNPVPLVPDATLLWRNQPGATRTQPVNPESFGRPATWTVRIDSRGYRGDGPAHAKEEGVYRILCVGDSITFGFNVDQQQVWPRLIEQQLGGRHAGARIEVVNAAVPGWSWLQGLTYLQTEGLALEPDLVVIGHGTNDQFSIAKITDEERLLRLGSTAEKAFRWAAMRASQSSLFRLLSTLTGDDQRLSPGCSAQVRSGGACHRVSHEQISDAVRAVARVTAAAGADLLVLNTDFIQTTAWGAARKVLDEGRIAYVDLVGELAARTDEDNRARAARLGLAPPGSPAPVGGAVLRVQVPEAGRRYRVIGTSYMKEATISESLFDDGTHGDEKAGDGVFSATIEVPDERRFIVYGYVQERKTEFTPLPPLPSTLGDRLLAVERGTFGPVDEFGRVLFKAERAHPDALGHEAIAGLVAKKIESFESFRKAVAAQ
jgi:lysophospholipase L1-like esterase